MTLGSWSVMSRELMPSKSKVRWNGSVTSALPFCWYSYQTNWSWGHNKTMSGFQQLETEPGKKKNQDKTNETNKQNTNFFFPCGFKPASIWHSILTLKSSGYWLCECVTKFLNHAQRYWESHYKCDPQKNARSQTSTKSHGNGIVWGK